MLHNEWDTVEIEMSPEAQDMSSRAPHFRNLLYRSNLCRGNHVISRQAFCWDLLAFLRARSWDEALIEGILKGRVDPSKPRSLDEELATLPHVINTLESGLARFATSMEEDEGIFHRLPSDAGPKAPPKQVEGQGEKGEDGWGLDAEVEEEASPHLLSAVTYRLTRKYILRDQLKLVELVLKRAREIKARRVQASTQAPKVSFLASPLPYPTLVYGEHDRLSAYFTTLAEIPFETPTPTTEAPALAKAEEGRSPPKGTGAAFKKGGKGSNRLSKEEKGAKGASYNRAEDEKEENLNPFIPPPIRTGSPTGKEDL